MLPPRRTGPYNPGVAERQPALLGSEPAAGAVPAATSDAATAPVEATLPELPSPRRGKAPSLLDLGRSAGAAGAGPDRRGATTVTVVGFWRRLGAGLIDLAVIVPVALIATWLVGLIIGIRPFAKLDIWLDLILASDPAFQLAFELGLVVAAIYAMVFQIAAGRTLGMRALGLRIVDVYGDSPSPRRSLVRTLGYVAGVATLLLGFVWIAIDREKRGLHDWIAGTYVIRG